jgi:hypothetical protein
VSAFKVARECRYDAALTPAMAAGVTDRLWEMSDMIGVLEAWEAAN